MFFGTSSCSDDAVNDGESLWGIRLSTGDKVWHFDAHAPGRYPSRHWDDDFGASPNLLPDGLVGCGGKDGWYYALDRETGALEWSTRAGQAGHITAGFAVGGMIGSAATGMVNGEPAIFATTAISTPLRAPMDETPFDIDPTLADDPGRMMSIHAMRASDGAILWRSPFVRASYGAASYAAGVVFVPSTFDFSVKALDANTGVLLWASPLPGAPSATPVPIGSRLIGGAGTRTTDVEYNVGAGALDASSGRRHWRPPRGSTASGSPAKTRSNSSGLAEKSRRCPACAWADRPQSGWNVKHGAGGGRQELGCRLHVIGSRPRVPDRCPMPPQHHRASRSRCPARPPPTARSPMSCWTSSNGAARDRAPIGVPPQHLVAVPPQRRRAAAVDEVGDEGVVLPHAPSGARVRDRQGRQIEHMRAVRLGVVVAGQRGARLEEFESLEPT